MNQLNPKHPLLQLPQKIPWVFLSQNSRPFIRVWVCQLKVTVDGGFEYARAHGDVSDDIIVQHWVQKAYYPAFCGEAEFQWEFPCDFSDWVYFRKRSGELGFEKILASLTLIHGEHAFEKEICIDTTVQEKNITFPTDASSTERLLSIV